MSNEPKTAQELADLGISQADAEWLEWRHEVQNREAEPDSKATDAGAKGSQ